MELANSVGAVERLGWNERFRAAASLAIRMRHADAAWLAHVQPEDIASEHLIDTVMRLEAWITEQPPLPIHPDSRLATRGD